MFCDYCLQLLDFSQGVTPHAPQQKPLGGDTRAFTNNQAFQRAETPALRMKIHEDDLRSEFEPLWWRAPAQQKDSPNLLSHSPDSNCAICNMIFSNVSASIVEGLRRFPQDTSSLHFVYKLDKARSLSIWLEVGSHLIPMIQFNLAYTIARENSNLLSFGESSKTGSLESSVLVASWLEHCLTHHPGCKHRHGSPNQAPSRLIDVGSTLDAQAPYLWSPGANMVTYVTLSHRWGNHELLTLTRASFAAMSAKIDVAMLSQTSQDAIAITRSLGLRYLWNDSLCIIQDDLTDWQVESAKMGEIFKSSLFTIAASWASSNTEGCFFDRRPLFAKLTLAKETQISSRALNNTASAGSHADRLRLSRRQSSKTRLLIDPPDPHTLSFRHILERRDHLRSSKIFTGIKHRPASGTLAHLRDRSVLVTSRDTEPNLVAGEKSEHAAPNEIVHFDPNRKQSYSDATPHISDDSDEGDDFVNISIRPKSGTNCTAAEPRSHDIEALYIVPSQKDLWLHSVESSPLNMRAWVLQERLLSSRIVYYTRTQLFWECRESKACETSPAPVPKMQTEWDGSLTYLKMSHELYGPNFEPWHRHWPEIVQKYTDTSRTKLEDKLVAISGLAREIQSITKDRYCSGIWRKDMVSQLLWRLSTPQHETDLPYQAPSWSWASTEGKVEFQQRSDECMTPELDITSVQSIGIDGKPWSFGQIEYGSLRCRGVLRPPLKCDRHEHKYKLLLTDQLDEELDTNEGEYHPDTAPGVLPETALCLPIARISAGVSLGQDENAVSGTITGLVIEPTGDFTRQYRRLGLFRLRETVGVVWFGLHDKQDLWDISLV